MSIFSHNNSTHILYSYYYVQDFAHFAAFLASFFLSFFFRCVRLYGLQFSQVSFVNETLISVGVLGEKKGNDNHNTKMKRFHLHISLCSYVSYTCLLSCYNVSLDLFSTAFSSLDLVSPAVLSILSQQVSCPWSKVRPQRHVYGHSC